MRYRCRMRQSKQRAYNKLIKNRSVRQSLGSIASSHILLSIKQSNTVAPHWKSLATQLATGSRIEGSLGHCFLDKITMAFFLDGIANFFDHFFGSVDSEDDYLDPPTSGGKRKAREELRRPSQSYKARRYSTPHFYAKFSAYDSDSSEDSDFSDGPQYLARGVHSETETDHSSTYEEYNPDHFLKHRNSLEKNRARAQSLRHQSSARRDSVHDSSPANRRRSSSSPRAVSRERVRKERLNFFDGLANIAKGVVSTIVGTEADEPKLIDDDIQKQLRDEYLVESEDSDAQLSEGALGRKYWSSTPLKPQRSKVARQTPVPPASVKVRPSAPGRFKDVKLPVDVPTHKSPGPT